MTTENSNQTPDQTLIPKDDDEQWRKVLHGELSPLENNETHMDAAKIRSYLIAKDEALAVYSADAQADLNAISPQEARMIYQRAAEEIRLRGKNTWLMGLKTYGVGALIGGLCATIVFLLYSKPPAATSPAQSSTRSDLNFSDYTVLAQKVSPDLLPNMILIPDGVTNIGCATGWDDVAGGCRSNEFPSHAVTIRPFEISQHEITYAQFNKFVEASGYITEAENNNRGCVHKDTEAVGQPFVMKPRLNWRNPGYEQDENYPVSCISWSDTQHYIAWLNAETGDVYRLPTEAEWEHAARGGKATAYFWGSSVSGDNQANYAGVTSPDSWEYAAPVGSFPANSYSVHDTAGNLWEWVQDCWHETHHDAPQDGSAREKCNDNNFKVRRGGSWDMNAAGIRSAIRSKGAIDDRSNLYGFRVAKGWQKPKK